VNRNEVSSVTTDTKSFDNIKYNFIYRMSKENLIRDSFEGHKLLTTFWAINQTSFLSTPLLYSITSLLHFTAREQVRCI